MAEADAQTVSAWAALGIALIALFWQAVSSRRAGHAERLPSRTPFWAASGAWVLFGILSRAMFVDRALLGVPFGWLLAGAGLFAVALLRWSRVDLPSLMEEEAAIIPPEAEEDEEEEEGLDSEGARLLRRILRLRRRSIAEVMLPIDRAPRLRIDDPRDSTLALFAQTGALHLPVTDEKGKAVLGALEARDLVGHAPAAAGALPFALRPLLKPLPSVNPNRKAVELLDLLKRSPTGMNVVCDPSGAPLGFVSWDQIFARLLATAVEDLHEPG